MAFTPQERRQLLEHLERIADGVKRVSLFKAPADASGTVPVRPMPTPSRFEGKVLAFLSEIADSTERWSLHRSPNSARGGTVPLAHHSPATAPRHPRRPRPGSGGGGGGGGGPNP